MGRPEEVLAAVLSATGEMLTLFSKTAVTIASLCLSVAVAFLKHFHAHGLVQFLP